MNVAIVTCLNNRRNVSSLVFECFKRLQNAPVIHNLTLIVGVHNKEDLDFAVHYDADCTIVELDQNVCGANFNQVLLEARYFDAVFIMGDDDTISTEYYLLALKRVENLHHVGLNANGYIDQKTGQCMVHRYQFKHKLIGAGRCLSQTAVNALFGSTVEVTTDYPPLGLTVGDRVTVTKRQAEYLRGMNYARNEVPSLPWDNELKKSLDHHIEMKLTWLGFPPVALQLDGIHVVDVKSYNEIKPQNIWPYSILADKCTPSSMDELTVFMSDEEIKICKPSNL
jgi:hypothetical protein